MKQPDTVDQPEPVTGEPVPPPSETCPKCGNFRGHTVRCYEQTEKDRAFRNAVLEEAAQACEREAKRWENEGPIPFRVALNCAADIRALKAQP